MGTPDQADGDARIQAYFSGRRIIRAHGKPVARLTAYEGPSGLEDLIAEQRR